MTAKYTVLDSQVLTTSAASVTFSSIPGGYKDLVLVMSTPGTATYGIGFVFNGDTTSTNSNWVVMWGDTSGTLSTTSNSYFFGAFYGADTNIVQIFDYSATDKHKSLLNRLNSTQGSRVQARAGRWGNTAAVTSLQLVTNGTAFSSGTTFRLLGVN